MFCQLFNLASVKIDLECSQDLTMTWIPLLLADRSVCLRWLVLRNLLDHDENDPETQELMPLREDDPLVAPVLAAQEADGAWTRGDLHWQGGKQRVTMLALLRLGFLGFGPDQHQDSIRKMILTKSMKWFLCRQLSRCVHW